MNSKKLTISIFISVFSLILIAPLIGYSTESLTILDRSNKPILIDESSTSAIQEAFAYPIRLINDQKVEIDISLINPNNTATLKILEKRQYDMSYSYNESPVYVNGEDFLFIQSNMGSPLYEGFLPSNFRTIYEFESYHIEFSGDTHGSNLIYRPGQYMLIVYGNNDGPAIETDIEFNLLIKIDGPGNIIELLLISISLLVLMTLCLTLIYHQITKFELPYKKKIKNDDILLIQN